MFFKSQSATPGCKLFNNKKGEIKKMEPSEIEQKNIFEIIEVDDCGWIFLKKFAKFFFPTVVACAILVWALNMAKI